jgi:protein-disulfide isomerase
MRQLLAVVLLIGCGGGERERVLERRIAELEAKPPAASPDPRVQTLQQRVDELESLLRELRQLQIQTQASVAQLAEHAAPPPPPPPLPAAAGLDHDRAYPVPLDDSPAFGTKTAAVTLVAAVQFPEPYTHRSWPVLQELRKQYGKELRLVVKTFIVHPQATDSSIAACAVARQGALEPYEDAMWLASNPTNAARHWPDASESRGIARDLGVDITRFDLDLAACKTGQTRDQALFKQLGQAAVPVFWINGHPLEGAMPIADFRTVIDAETKKALADRKKGGKPATYYDRITKP